MCRIAATKVRRNKGFTLIEVLVAIAIFATMSVAAYQVVNQVQRSDEVSRKETDQLKQLQRALVFLNNDFRQIAQRHFRTNGSDPSSNYIDYQEYLLDSDDKGVMFTRYGFFNPMQQFPRGEVTKVGYRVKNKVLQRVWWRYPDTPAGDKGEVMPLLTGVESFSLRFYDGSEWSEEWDQDSKLPKAIEVDLTLSDYGKIKRIYLVASDDNSSSNSSDSGGSSDT
ncbi:type II secretion system minor pseudopilin GspJ [Vibrio marisflavi]|uniref:Type II secretion system protein J n=1 Tax=Vibrio marisflavi CECT 7928 TaxID=634439 RepID=A0ABM9A810_9VIBR|nr:type II secretion system minor pseudopilin GspJ [Vibrio marisflavi]CAH0541860.1 Type II secretion system protein J [Vibrio marisflavi CECT 7928]